MDTKAIRTALRRWGLYGWTFMKWTAAAAVIGAACGLVGTLFHFGVHEVTAFRGTHPWVLYLPAAGGAGHCGLLQADRNGRSGYR